MKRFGIGIDAALARLDGLATGSIVQEGTISEDVPILAGAPYRLVLHVKTAAAPAAGPLLDACDDYFESIAP